MHSRSTFREAFSVRAVAVLVILLALPSYGIASEICVPPERPINALELRKPLLLAGDYEGFLWTIPAARADLDQLNEQVASLSEVFPNGFSNCATVGQNWHSESLVSELIAFRAEGDEFLYLTWTAFEFDGSWTIGRFGVDTGFSAALENLR